MDGITNQGVLINSSYINNQDIDRNNQIAITGRAEFSNNTLHPFITRPLENNNVDSVRISVPFSDVIISNTININDTYYTPSEEELTLLRKDTHFDSLVHFFKIGNSFLINLVRQNLFTYSIPSNKFTSHKILLEVLKLYHKNKTFPTLDELVFHLIKDGCKCLMNNFSSIEINRT